MSFRIVEPFACNRVSAIVFRRPLRTLASIMVRLAGIDYRVVHFSTLEARVSSTVDPSDFAIAAVCSCLQLLLAVFGFNFQFGLKANFVQHGQVIGETHSCSLFFGKREYFFDLNYEK